MLPENMASMDRMIVREAICMHAEEPVILESRIRAENPKGMIFLCFATCIGKI
jgi:hypothetical protein